MIKKLKLANKVFRWFVVTNFLSLCIVALCIFCMILTYMQNVTDFESTVFIGFLSILVCWLIFFLNVIFAKQAIITSEKIALVRHKKVYWVIKKADIYECLYQEVRLWNFFYPISQMCSLRFRLLNGSVSIKQLHLSKKQLKKIKENFDYPITIINSKHGQ